MDGLLQQRAYQRRARCYQSYDDLPPLRTHLHARARAGCIPFLWAARKADDALRWTARAVHCTRTGTARRDEYAVRTQWERRPIAPGPRVRGTTGTPVR